MALDVLTAALIAAEDHPGPHGERGVQGPEGKAGLDGLPGAIGPQGEPGLDGQPGPIGPAGQDGRDGLDGKRGPKGEKGDEGEKGEPGTPGGIAGGRGGFPRGLASGLIVADEGTRLNSGTVLGEIDFAGAGVTVTQSGPKALVTIAGSAGGVASVNGQTGVVVLDAGDVWMAGARAAKVDLMPAIPTVTTGVADAASVIASSVLTVSMQDIFGADTVDYSIYRYGGAPMAAQGPFWPDINFASSFSPYLAYRVTFTTNADEFEFWTKGTAGKFRINVNGKRATKGPVTGPPANGSLYLIHVDFGSAGTREVTIEMASQSFGGIRVGPSYSVTDPISAAPSVRAIVLGDSYTYGSGADAFFTTYVQAMGNVIGWDEWDVWASGIGASGYTSGTTFRSRVAADVIAHSPDVVIVAGGLNDVEAGLEAEANLLFADIASGLPAARLYVLSPWCPRGGTLSPLLAVKTAALASAANTAGANYIDTSTIPWLSGTGDADAPNGTGNSDIYVGTDHTHPTQEGHDYLGYRLAGHVW